MKELYVKTTFAEPNLAATVHIAELAPIQGTNMCTMTRLIEMLDGQNVTGIWSARGTNKGLMNKPNKHVPHPDSYGDFPDINVEMISHLEFEGIWLEANANL